MSTHNICFRRDIRKLFTDQGLHCLSGPMTLSSCHTRSCPKILNGPLYYLLMCLKYCCMYGKQCRPWSDVAFYSIWSGLHWCKAYLSQYLGLLWYFSRWQTDDTVQWIWFWQPPHLTFNLNIKSKPEVQTVEPPSAFSHKLCEMPNMFSSKSQWLWFGSFSTHKMSIIATGKAMFPTKKHHRILVEAPWFRGLVGWSLTAQSTLLRLCKGGQFT